jgi:hypothetical protein
LNSRRAIVLPVLIAGLICLPGASAADGPEAHQSAQCGSVSTGNGGEARYINAISVTCSKARKVAKKARGQKKFKSSRLTCKRKAKTISGVGYNCTRRGLKGGVGFIYVKP